MSAALELKLALARAVAVASRVRGGGGTSLPGKLLLRLQPDAIELLASRLDGESVAVSATNGKTTTAAMIASVLHAAGVPLVHNQAGANMAGGIASSLLASTAAGRARAGGGTGARRGNGEAGARGGREAGAAAAGGTVGLFEVDEFWLDRLVPQLRPRAVVLGNLFRDQLDRYGELDMIADRWAAALSDGAGARAMLVCNADDAMIADLGRERARERVVYFGVDDPSLALAGMAHAADAKHCRRCGTPYEFDAVYLGHLGHYRCPGCGQQRPSPTVLASHVRLEGVRAARFRLSTPQGDADVQLALPGLYNVYNALAAAALGIALDVPLEKIVQGLQGTRAAFGRAEALRVDGGRELRILLVKNPAGANEVLRTLALEPGEHDLLGVLNDRTADGRDVSWIWDADFELLAGRVRRVTCAGTRAPELALRLKYAGVDPERIVVQPQLDEALRGALAYRPAHTGIAGVAGHRDADAEDGGGEPPLYALPTYTAMLALRELLVKRGEAGSSWR